MNTENPLQTIITDGGYTAIFRTIACIGDSLASGEHESCTEDGVVGYHDYYEYSWGQFIARKCGSKVTNYSRGGLTASQFHSLADDKKCFTQENACQAYIIALGVNDASRIMEGQMQLGSLDDVDFTDFEKNKDTFIGQYTKILQRIRLLQPKARIFMITPPKSTWHNKGRNALYDTMQAFFYKLTEIFAFSYVIDLRKYEREYDDDFKKFYFLGGHLSAMGYKRSADVISTYIDYIIRNNPDDFKQVGFIGKDVYNRNEKW